MSIKTCKRGLHEMTPENTYSYTTAKGLVKNRCRACIKQRNRTNWNNESDHLGPDTVKDLQGYKVPLREVPGGFGYYGTLAYDKATYEYSQCHMCGNFFKHLGQHILHFHSMNSREYKQKFGLPVTMSLLAPQSPYQRESRWSTMTDEQKAAQRTQFTAVRSLNSGPRVIKEPLLFKNLKGRCPDQLIDKIQQMIKETNTIPVRRDFSDRYGYGDMGAIYRTYGQWSVALDLAMKDLGVSYADK